MTDKQDSTGWTEPVATALLVLADGTVLEGVGFGATGQAVGEVCFNTAMSGYQEILTDPSYKGQLVCMTAPHIGNTGVNEEDVESRRPRVEGFIVREASPRPSSPLPARAPEDAVPPWLRILGETQAEVAGSTVSERATVGAA